MHLYRHRLDAWNAIYAFLPHSSPLQVKRLVFRGSEDSASSSAQSHAMEQSDASTISKDSEVPRLRNQIVVYVSAGEKQMNGDREIHARIHSVRQRSLSVILFSANTATIENKTRIEC